MPRDMETGLLDRAGAAPATAAPLREVAPNPDGEGVIGTRRTVLDAQQLEQEATLEDRGIRGVVLSYRSGGAAEAVELPLSFANIECAGPTLTVTVHAAVHPGCEQKGTTIPLKCSTASTAESWQHEMERAVEKANERHWGVSKGFMREQRERWKMEGQRCKGMTVAQYFEDIGHGEVYAATWGWCAGVLAGLEAKPEKSVHDLKEIDYYRRKVGRSELYEDMELTDYMNILKQQDLVPAGKKVMYADFVAAESDSTGRRKVGKATVFVSHVWKMAAKDFFEVCLYEMAEDDYAWIDLYLHNQYQGAISDIGDENSEYWISKFGELIGGIKKVIAIVTDWQAPVMLTRIWCLFELNAAIETGAELRFVSTAAERQSLSLNLNKKFQQLDRLVSNIEVRDCDAKRPHEIQDKSIFLKKLHGIEDEVNEKLRHRMQGWLCEASKDVIYRTDPSRARLDEAAMAIEVATTGDCWDGGAKLTQLLERLPRLPPLLTMLAVPMVLAGLFELLALFMLLTSGLSSLTSKVKSGETTTTRVVVTILLLGVVGLGLLFGGWMVNKLGFQFAKHQEARQLRQPALLGSWAMRQNHNTIYFLVLVGVIVAVTVLTDIAPFGIMAGLVAAFAVSVPLQLGRNISASRASLCAKAGWLRLRLGDAAGAAEQLGEAQAQLQRSVGSNDALNSWVAAAAQARALCDAGLEEAAMEVRVSCFGCRRRPVGVRPRLEAAAARGADGGDSCMSTNHRRLQPWRKYGPLLRAGMAAAVRAPDTEVLGLLGEAAQMNCWVPAGSRPLDSPGYEPYLTEGGLPEWDEFLGRMARGNDGADRRRWMAYCDTTIELARQRVATIDVAAALVSRGLDDVAEDETLDKQQRARLLANLFEHPAYMFGAAESQVQLPVHLSLPFGVTLQGDTRPVRHLVAQTQSVAERNFAAAPGTLTRVMTSWVTKQADDETAADPHNRFGVDPIPSAGKHYVEVTFTSYRGSGANHQGAESLRSKGFVGVTSHTTPHWGNELSKKNGAWGFRDDDDNDGLRVNGKSNGKIRPLNQHGRSYSAGDRVGLLIDMDQKIMQLYRNGEPIQGAIVSGFPQMVWLAMCVPSSEWDASMTFLTGDHISQSPIMIAADETTAAPALVGGYAPEPTDGAARSSFATVWSPDKQWQLKDTELMLDEAALVASANFTMFDLGLIVFSAAELPPTGEHYFEMTCQGAKLSEALWTAAVGIWAGPAERLPKSDAIDITKGGRPFWGLRGDGDNDALRVEGRGQGKVGHNGSSGKAISSNERIGVLVNMDSSTMTFFRDGAPIPDGVVRGFPRDNVRIAACCQKGTITLAWPACYSDHRASFDLQCEREREPEFLPAPEPEPEHNLTRHASGLISERHSTTDSTTLHAILDKTRLLHFHSVLTEMGAVELLDLKELSEEDYIEMGMMKLEARRLCREVESQTA